MLSENQFKTFCAESLLAQNVEKWRYRKKHFEDFLGKAPPTGFAQKLTKNYIQPKSLKVAQKVSRLI